MARFPVFSLFLIAPIISTVDAWSGSCTHTIPSRTTTRSSLPNYAFSNTVVALKAIENADSNDADVDLVYLKAELHKYLEKRREVGADDIAKQEVGKSFGGTRGNALLDYVSFAPNKGSVVTAAPNIFDYSELERYGFSYLSTAIMKAGGRLAMYDLMDLERPAISRKPKSTTTDTVVIDRTGQNDAARYSGLKLGQILDDNLQGSVLAEAQRKMKEGQSLRPKLIEEEYERPFADNTKVTSDKNPYWTTERLDEWGRMRGKVIAEAKRAEAEKLVADKMETLDLEISQRLYAILTALLVAIAFGKSTPTFLFQVLSFQQGEGQMGTELLDIAKAPAAALLLASIGSSVVCVVKASEKQRNAFVWMIKGLLGGPLSIRQLKDLPTLVTRRELDDARQREKP